MAKTGRIDQIVKTSDGYRSSVRSARIKQKSLLGAMRLKIPKMSSNLNRYYMDCVKAKK